MEWVIAAQAATPLWVAPLLGGVGAVVGGSLTSLVSWRALSDSKKARVQAEERQATEEVSKAFTSAFSASRKELPEGVGSWHQHYYELMSSAEVGVLTFRDPAVRDRLGTSVEMIRWGATSRDVQDHAGASSSGLAYAAYKDALACLGANLRGERLPPRAMAWTQALDAMVDVRGMYEEHEQS